MSHLLVNEETARAFQEIANDFDGFELEEKNYCSKDEAIIIPIMDKESCIIEPAYDIFHPQPPKKKSRKCSNNRKKHKRK